MNFAALRIPLRYKILVTLLLVVTVVVSIIIFTMVNLFHRDKTAYIRDLTSYIALQTAEETELLMKGYEERLRAFAKLVYESGLSQDQKASLLKRLFENSREFVAITVHEEGVKPVTVYDRKSLESAGLTIDDLTAYRRAQPLPQRQALADSVYVENSTLSPQLATLTMAISFLPADARRHVVLEAMIRLTTLQRIVSSTRVFEVFLVDSRDVLLAHRDQQLTAQRIAITWLPKLEGLKDGLSASSTVEHTRNGIALIGGFARVTVGRLLVGVEIPKEAASVTARDLLANLLLVALILLIVAAVLSTFWSRRITSPIEQLSRAALVVGTGRFDVQVPKTSQDEIGDLAESFNQMASELARREQALKEAQLALVQSEKMAAFGQLGAGIAHEVKNPLAGILGFAQLSLRKTEKESPLYKNLEVIEKETKRCKNIIENLLKFARQETVAFQSTDLHQVVEDTIGLMEHQLGIHQIKVHKDLAAGLPPFMGNANQIQQVLMNLLINTQQALDGSPGDVRIATGLRDDGRLEIRIKDSGPGIPKEIQSRLFEPFFTTKPAGKGTGLGLSVSYGIITDHRGEIQVTSEVGSGAEFIIILPQLAADAGPAEGA